MLLGGMEEKRVLKSLETWSLKKTWYSNWVWYFFSTASTMFWIAMKVLGPTEQPMSVILKVLLGKEWMSMSSFSTIASLMSSFTASITSLCKSINNNKWVNYNYKKKLITIKFLYFMKRNYLVPFIFDKRVKKNFYIK